MHDRVRTESALVHRRDRGTASRRSAAGRAVQCAPSLLSRSTFSPRTRQRSARGRCPTPFPVWRPLERFCPHKPQRLVSIDRERLSPSSEWAPCECGHLCRQSSAIRTGCANERPSGSVRGAISNGCPYRDPTTGFLALDAAFRQLSSSAFLQINSERFRLAPWTFSRTWGKIPITSPLS
jgi:hypothetical protein